ncbi:MAG: LPS assembly lipoprotein LptE [Terriglobales bacterium]
MRGTVLSLTCLAVFLLAGCGYHNMARLTRLPPTVRIIAVPGLQNRTRLPGISQSISAAVAQELIQRGYRVQPDVEGSDAVLEGTVLDLQFTPVTFDPVSGRATTVEIRMHLDARLTDHHTGKELYRNDDLVFHDQYQVSPNSRDFVEENPLAIQRLSRTVAATVVSAVLENF